MNVSWKRITSPSILHEDPGRLGRPVNLLIPPEVRRDGEVDAKEGTGDRLDLCLHPTKLSEASQTPHFHNHLRELREAMYEPVHQSTSVLDTDEFTNLWRIEVEVTVPRLMNGLQL